MTFAIASADIIDNASFPMTTIVVASTPTVATIVVFVAVAAIVIACALVAIFIAIVVFMFAALAIANRFFGHTDHHHQLITPRERAFTEFGIRPGARVSFRFDGQHHIGVVNRITKRATVLVEDKRGERYSDGKRYTKFYVPVSLLELMEE